MDNAAPITRAEHEEFRRRIEAEEHRQNRRLEELEETVRQIQALTISVEKMAVSPAGACFGFDRMYQRHSRAGCGGDLSYPGHAGWLSARIQRRSVCGTQSKRAFLY